MHITQKSKEVWDRVAENYISEITHSDIEIADALEESLKKIGIEPTSKLLELGCGSGHISARLGQKGYNISLLDFSPVAIEKSKEVCEKHNIEATYYEKDFFALDDVEEQDVVWNSGVLEHFNENELGLIFKQVKKLNAKYFIFLVPNVNSLPYILFRYHKMSRGEWEYDYEYLRDNYEEVIHKLGMKVIYTKYLAKELTNYLFSVGNENNRYVEYLAELNENGLLEENQLYLKMYVVDLQGVGTPITSIDESNDMIKFKTDKFDLISRLNGYKYEVEKINRYLQEQTETNKELSDESNLLKINLDKLEEIIKNGQVNSSIQEEKIKELTQVNSIQEEKTKELTQVNSIQEEKIKELTQVNSIQEERIKELAQINNMQEQQIEKLIHILDRNNEIQKSNINQADGENIEVNNVARIYQEREEVINNLDMIHQEKEQCMRLINARLQTYEETLRGIYNSHLWKAGLKYYRIRDNFPPIKWLHKTVKKARLQNKIENNQEICTNENATNTPSALDKPQTKEGESIKKENTKIVLEPGVEKQKYMKQDILLLSVIDWDFRFQRPQHLAKNLAKLGHRVFYFNANYNSKDVKIREINSNLYEVTLGNSYGQRIYDIEFEHTNNDAYKKEVKYVMDKYNIREASVIVEYPTWEPVARYMKELYGFKIAFDYIDDYTGFEETNNQNLLVHTKKLLELSELTIATSVFLEEKATQYSSNVKIIRNGTEFDFFNKAYTTEKTRKNRPKIGYYGAIAEWFDTEKVAYIAENKPEYDIELIGHVSSERAEALKQYKNIKFLGEKDYKTLPQYLQEYDVCLIPFQSDIDLIKATNPVKFYEYLSAGKKIVATEIPELEIFRDEYVYLANDKQKFLEYVNLCVEGKDTLKAPEELVRMARTHDWEERCKTLAQELKEIHPLVSIILVTYNNLHYTKQCMESLINKTAYPNYEIIIVDNDSKDDTPTYLKQLEKDVDCVKVILNNNNSGFAGGNNIGIKASQGEYIILLNNDTLVTRGWITSLIKHLDKENIGMVGPVTNSIGNESQINIDYSNIEDMDRFAIEYTTLHHNEIYKDIKVLAMFCVAIKREIMDEIGLLDENYKVGMFEDDDYSMAINKKGYEVVCVEDTYIHHFGNASFKKIEDKKYQEIFNHNKKYFEQKWDVVWTPHKYREGVTI